MFEILLGGIVGGSIGVAVCEAIKWLIDRCHV